MKKQMSQIGTDEVLDAFDEAADCHENIAVIAELIEPIDADEPFSRHDARILTGVARLITNEERKLRVALDVIQKHYPRTDTNMHSKASDKAGRITSKSRRTGVQQDSRL